MRRKPFAYRSHSRHSALTRIDQGIGCTTLVILFWVSLCPPSLAGAPGAVDFRRDIQPILSENCFLCHGPDSRTRKADLRLDTKEGALRTADPVIVPGKSADSELFRRVSSTDPDEAMPPRKSGKSLSSSQVELLKRWLDQGASWSKHWAFET